MSSRIDSLVGGIARPIVRVLVVVLFAVLFTRPAAAQDDMVLKWNETAALTATATNPFNQARIMAIIQLAVFEAVNAINGGYEPYLNPPTAAPDGGSVEAAVVMAAHRALTNYFTVPATVALLNAARDSDLATIADGPAKVAGMAVGMAAANAMIALRLTDGSATAPLTNIPSPASAGDYALTTGCAVERVLQLAAGDAVRYRESGGLPPAGATCSGESAIHEGLLRSKDGWRAQ